MPPNNDHDAIVTLIETVKNIKEGQDVFHTSMGKNMEELKNNYSGRLDANEIRIFRLESSKTKQMTLTSIGIGILTLLSSLMTIHMFK